MMTSTPKTTISTKNASKALEFICSFILLIGLLITLPTTVSAASPSPAASAPPRVTPKASVRPTATPKPSTSASPSASPSTQATENLKERIDRVLEQRQEKLKELEDSGQRRRLFIGEVQRIIEQTITLKTRRGNQSFTITPDLNLIRDNKKSTIDDVAIGDTVAIIGYQDKETIQPQRIFIFTTSLQPVKYETVLGTIKDVNRTQVTVTKADDSDQKFTFARTTEFQTSTGEAGKRENLKKDDKVLVITKPESTQSPLVIRSL